MEDKVYILVVTYNAERWIDYFAPAFMVLPNYWRVIVVDNASSDSTVDLIRAKYGHFLLIDNLKNLGFGAANNIGFKIAMNECADYVFLLNQDARISIETIQKMISIHKKCPDYFVLSPIQLRGDGSELEHSFASYCHPVYCPKMYADALKATEIQDVYTVAGVNAAAWLVSSQCLRQIGGFNPSFFHYGEDDEYLQRVIFHKKLVGVAPSCFAEHARETSLFDADTRRYIMNTFLIEYCNQVNINSFDKMLMLLLAKSVKKLICFSPHVAGCIFLAAFDLLKKRSKIVHSKIEASKIGSPFIT